MDSKIIFRPCYQLCKKCCEIKLLSDFPVARNPLEFQTSSQKKRLNYYCKVCKECRKSMNRYANRKQKNKVMKISYIAK